LKLNSNLTYAFHASQAAFLLRSSAGGGGNRGRACDKPKHDTEYSVRFSRLGKPDKKLLNDGMSLRAIAEAAGVNASTVLRTLNSSGVANATPDEIIGRAGICQVSHLGHLTRLLTVWE